jgi:hypothetical protein
MMTNLIKTRIAVLFFSGALALPALAQQPSPLPMPPQLEKDLSARAADVTEVTLNKNMLGFASKFMHNKGDDDANVRQLIEGLDGIYVRNYEFEKEGEYQPEELDQLRRAFATPDWTPIIHERERRGETTDILMKVVNGENKGMFILNAEPRELSIVLILGPIRMEDLGRLHGLAGLGALSYADRDDMQKTRQKAREDRDKAREKDKDRTKDKDKDKDKDKKDGDQ